MNLPERDLENLLRQAPQPKPPRDLKARLLAQAPASLSRTAADFSAVAAASTEGGPQSRGGLDGSGLAGWLRRWWLSLIPAAGALACAGVIGIQQTEIRALRATIETLKQQGSPTESGPANSDSKQTNTAAPTAAESPEDQEIARLRQTAGQLQAEIAQLTQLRAENNKLREQIASQTAKSGLTREETEAMSQARERVANIQCVNNLKQFGLATKVWALDNGDTLPPNIIVMSNELSTPKILVCPADKSHTAVSSWGSFTAANVTYEYLTPLAKDDEPNRVLSRCPIHGTIGLVDGSVQMGAMTNHPDWFQEKDGKLYYLPPGDNNLNSRGQK
jgi:hypothetical protein